MVDANRSLFDHRKPQSSQLGGGSPCVPLSAAQQIAALRQFVAEVGGLENARQALDMLAALNQRTH